MVRARPPYALEAGDTEFIAAVVDNKFIVKPKADPSQPELTGEMDLHTVLFSLPLSLLHPPPPLRPHQ